MPSCAMGYDLTNTGRSMTVQPYPNKFISTTPS